MARVTSLEAEKATIKAAASMMLAAARTAPKARGQDSVQAVIVDGEDQALLASAMEAKMTEKAHRIASFERDAQVVRKAGSVLLIGVTGEPKKVDNPLNCGACGHQNCETFLRAKKREGEDFRGPLCVFQALDLGIALGSAAKMASELNVDNRMMYTLGAAARKLGLLECDIIIGFPLSVTGKNPSFDR